MNSVADTKVEHTTKFFYDENFGCGTAHGQVYNLLQAVHKHTHAQVACEWLAVRFLLHTVATLNSHITALLTQSQDVRPTPKLNKEQLLFIDDSMVLNDEHTSRQLHEMLEDC